MNSSDVGKILLGIQTIIRDFKVKCLNIMLKRYKIVTMQVTILKEI